jgi:hypothetical protein
LHPTAHENNRQGSLQTPRDESNQRMTPSTDVQHTAMQALFVAWYNFGRRHEALKGRKPAMAHNLTTEVWTVRKMLEMVTA